MGDKDTPSNRRRQKPPAYLRSRLSGFVSFPTPPGAEDGIICSCELKFLTRLERYKIPALRGDGLDPLVFQHFSCVSCFLLKIRQNAKYVVIFQIFFVVIQRGLRNSKFFPRNNRRAFRFLLFSPSRPDIIRIRTNQSIRPELIGRRLR